MSSPSVGHAAVLGLGIVGSRVVARLLEGDRHVICWNRTSKGLPCEVATPLAAIAGAATISLYLKDAPAVRGVMEGIAAHLHPEQIVLNHSTVDLATTQWLAERCKSRGCRFLDAPFTGSKVAAGSGQLVYYIGGEPADLEDVAELLARSSRKVIHCGGVGTATVVKLATNLVSACTVQALAEALAIATHSGVPAPRFVEAIAENACASVLSAMKLPSMANGDFDTHFSLSNMAKDSRYAIALADAAGLETPAIASVSQRMAQLEAAGLGDLDYSALAHPYLDSEVG
jgi:3-hydroxyisobutyrate dehydrogenase-like beta-hydroxyacid dehydrogenase